MNEVVRERVVADGDAAAGVVRDLVAAHLHIGLFVSDHAERAVRADRVARESTYPTYAHVRQCDEDGLGSCGRVLENADGGYLRHVVVHLVADTVVTGYTAYTTATAANVVVRTSGF